MFGRDNQPIQIASPTIERTQQRPDNRAINQRKQEDRCWIFREATYVPHFVGRAQARAGVISKSQDRL